MFMFILLGVQHVAVNNVCVCVGVLHVPVYLIGVQHVPDHRVYLVRAQDQESPGELQRGQGNN